ncbi:hypothetical protein EDD86DRAFT_214596 [Gorgonomyces haynaldii]|nr:hypothetical protein EDD86DRAFT_214596 [Gorgonomyces haynaldii]
MSLDQKVPVIEEDPIFSGQLSRIIVLVVAILGIVFSLLSYAVLQIYREEKPFRAASRTFLSLLIIGSFSTWAAMISSAMLPVHPTKNMCFATFGLQTLSFASVYGIVMTKALRYAQQAKIKPYPLVKISDQNLWKGYVFNIAFTIFLALMSPFGGKFISIQEYVFRNGTPMPVCQMGWIRTVSNVAYLSSITGCWIVLYKLRVLDVPYGEKQWLIWALFVWTIQTLGQAFLESGSLHPTRQFIVENVNLASFVTLLALVLVKVRQ